MLNIFCAPRPRDCGSDQKKVISSHLTRQACGSDRRCFNKVKESMWHTGRKIIEMQYILITVSRIQRVVEHSAK
jgi:hypothetical protein